MKKKIKNKKIEGNISKDIGKLLKLKRKMKQSKIE